MFLFLGEESAWGGCGSWDLEGGGNRESRCSSWLALRREKLGVGTGAARFQAALGPCCSFVEKWSRLECCGSVAWCAVRSDWFVCDFVGGCGTAEWRMVVVESGSI